MFFGFCQKVRLIYPASPDLTSPHPVPDLYRKSEKCLIYKGTSSNVIEMLEKQDKLSFEF